MRGPEICEARWVSPQSRRRDPAGDRGQQGRSGPPGRRPGAAGLTGPPPNALFAEMLKAARELLAVRSPLDAELMVSELLGTWWGQQGGRRGPRRRADIEEIVGEGLVGYAASQGSPAALALLSGIACLGTPRQAAQAEQAALSLMDSGVARPAWAEHVGAVEAAECYVNSDAYGDRDEVVCVFSYAGQEQHALVVVVDYNAGGLTRDGWVTSQVGKLLDYCQNSGGSGSSFTQIDAPQARRILATGLAVTEAAADPPVSSSFPSYHAFIRARIRTLPPTLPSGAASHGPPVLLTAASKRLHWRRDRRAMLAAEFLASDEAEDLSDRESASRCADHIVDYGCDRDFGRPLRVSPAKAETFLLDWLPRKVMLSRAEQDAMPHVLLAWVRWAGQRSSLSDSAIGATLEAVFEAIPGFASGYKDPASLGLEPAMARRLLPDGDLEALARRVFAFPLLRGSYQGTDLSRLDPARPQDRAILLAADHADTKARRPAADHVDQHVELADRLWRGDPPELWEAAQRLLDLGEDRHEVLHILIETVRSAGPRESDIAAALADLPPEERG